MEIILYNNRDRNNVVNKVLEEFRKLPSALFKADATNSIHANITITNNLNDENAYNYVYVSTLKRYYYIDDVTYLVGNKIQLSCRLDVLMTHKDLIYNQSGIVERQQFQANLYLSDSEYYTESRRTQTIIPFNDIFNGYMYLMTVLGG